jgi:ABC-type transport system involved in cytochrome c biogenesis permease component
MVVLPMVERELLVAARRPGTYWVRFWAALAALAIWIILLKGSHAAVAQMGHELLNGLGILTLAFAMFSGVFLAADCLAEEKREGTLGLLFLTDLKAHDVVLGKVAARMLNVFFGLLAVFPVLALPMLMGGVTGREFSRLLLVLATTAFFSLGVSTLASAVSGEAKQAMLRALTGVVTLAGVCPALWWLQSLLWKSASLDWLLLPSPAYAYIKALDSSRWGWGAPAFWWSLGTIFSIGLGSILAATLLLPLTWQAGGASSRVKTGPGGMRRVSPGPGGFREPITHWNPMFWLAARDEAPRLQARRLLLALAPLWLAFFVASLLFRAKTIPVAFIVSFILAYALHQIIKVFVAAEAGRRMNQDRQSGALELLLVTPVPVRWILSGQRDAIGRHFRGSALVLCLLNMGLVGLVMLAPKAVILDWDGRLLFCEVFLGGILMLPLDLHALTWVGMWRGLNCRQHHRAVIETVLQVMGAPWLAVFLFFFVQPRFGGTGDAMAIVACWFGVGILMDLYFAEAARRRLTLQLRAKAGLGG